MEPFDSEWLTDAANKVSTFVADMRDAVVVVTVLGGPEGDVALTLRLTGGVLQVETTLHPEPDVAITIPWNDAIAVIKGTTSPAVAYMQGKLKSSGDMTLFLDLLSRAQA